MNLYQERDLNKLPKWAQEYFADIRRQRDVAVRALNEFQDTQTPSRIWVDDHVCTGEEQGPSSKRNYIQSRHITIRVGEDEIYFYLREDHDLEINVGGNNLVFQPSASNAIRIKVKP